MATETDTTWLAFEFLARFDTSKAERLEIGSGEGKTRSGFTASWISNLRSSDTGPRALGNPIIRSSLVFYLHNLPSIKADWYNEASRCSGVEDEISDKIQLTRSSSLHNICAHDESNSTVLSRHLTQSLS